MSTTTIIPTVSDATDVHTNIIIPENDSSQQQQQQEKEEKETIALATTRILNKENQQEEEITTILENNKINIKSEINNENNKQQIKKKIEFNNEELIIIFLNKIFSFTINIKSFQKDDILLFCNLQSISKQWFNILNNTTIINNNNNNNNTIIINDNTKSLQNFIFSIWKNFYIDLVRNRNYFPEKVTLNAPNPFTEESRLRNNTNNTTNNNTNSVILLYKRQLISLFKKYKEMSDHLEDERFEKLMGVESTIVNGILPKSRYEKVNFINLEHYLSNKDIATTFISEENNEKTNHTTNELQINVENNVTNNAENNVENNVTDMELKEITTTLQKKKKTILIIKTTPLESIAHFLYETIFSKLDKSYKNNYEFEIILGNVWEITKSDIAIFGIDVMNDSSLKNLLDLVIHPQLIPYLYNTSQPKLLIGINDLQRTALQTNITMKQYISRDFCNQLALVLQFFTYIEIDHLIYQLYEPYFNETINKSLQKTITALQQESQQQLQQEKQSMNELKKQFNRKSKKFYTNYEQNERKLKEKKELERQYFLELQNQMDDEMILQNLQNGLTDSNLNSPFVMSEEEENNLLKLNSGNKYKQLEKEMSLISNVNLLFDILIYTLENGINKKKKEVLELDSSTIMMDGNNNNGISAINNSGNTNNKYFPEITEIKVPFDFLPKEERERIQKEREEQQTRQLEQQQHNEQNNYCCIIL
ncbi:hypothetical protein ABK040_012102 [Willaertia magna]